MEEGPRDAFDAMFQKGLQRGDSFKILQVLYDRMAARTRKLGVTPRSRAELLESRSMPDRFTTPLARNGPR